MAVPGTAPLVFNDLICPNCSGTMEKAAVPNANGTLKALFYGCKACNYSYEHSPDHARGDFKAYSEFEAAKLKANPTSEE